MTKLDWNKCKAKLPDIEATSKPIKPGPKSIFVDSKITIGKYKGTPISNIPESYLCWMLKEKVAKNWKDVEKIRNTISPL